MKTWYELWSKAGASPTYRVDDVEFYLSGLNWFPNWVQNHFFNKISDYLLSLFFIIMFNFIFIIFFVLMQSGRGAELGAAFGGVGQSQSTRSEMSGIGKATTVVAVLFMLTSLILALLSSEKARESVVRDIKAIPVVPGLEEPVLPSNEIQIPADGVVVPPKSEVLLLFERRPTTKDDGFAVFVMSED